MSNANLIASVRQRLRNKAEATGEVFDFVISRYAIERLLYRLSVSELNTSFVLKGALLFYVWNGQLHRPTRDLDFLGSGPADADSIKEAFQSIAATSVPEDGLTFFPDTITAEPIREQALYSGIRVGLLVKLGSIKIQVQIDVGFGDAITPGPEESEFPSLLSDFPAPKIRSYPGLHGCRREARGHGHARRQQQPHEGLLRYPLHPSNGEARRVCSFRGHPKHFCTTEDPVATVTAPVSGC